MLNSTTFHRRALLALTLMLLLPAPGVWAQDGKSDYKLGLIVGNEERSRLDGDILTVSTDAFVRSRRFSVIERSQLDAVFTETDLQSFLGRGQADLSEILGLDLLGLVEYTTERSTGPAAGGGEAIFIKVRLVDVVTGEVLVTVSSERSAVMAATSPRVAGERLYESIRAAFPPMGYIIKAAGDERFVVDLGTELGVADGDVLEVVREGDQLIHPVTGKPMPAEQITIGTLKVTEARNSMAHCKLKGADGDIQVGDRVRFSPKSTLGLRWTKKVLSRFIPK